MCANYTPTRAERLEALLETSVDEPLSFKHECYPSNLAPLIRNAEGLPDESGFERQLDYGMFGLVPPWADLRLARSTYNARTETVATKPSFRSAWKRQQFCAIPVDNFFEPNYESGKPIRWQIEHADGKPLCVAGLWDWRPNGGPDDRPLVSFTMLTINADDHPLMRRFHKPGEEKRMIVLLDFDEVDAWLQTHLENAQEFFKQYDAEKLTAVVAPKATRAKNTPVETPEDAFEDRFLF